MQIKLIDFGYTNAPNRAHYNDAGADVYATNKVTIQPGGSYRMPLGFGIELPDGFSAYVYPRSSMASKGIVCELAPIDSGYRGQIHAILNNVSSAAYTVEIDDRVGQLVVIPTIIATFTEAVSATRGEGAFGTTGK